MNNVMKTAMTATDRLCTRYYTQLVIIIIIIIIIYSLKRQVSSVLPLQRRLLPQDRRTLEE